MNVTSTSPLEAAEDPDKDEYFYSIKKRIYASAKEGFPLNLQVLISKIDPANNQQTVLVNQASDVLVMTGYSQVIVSCGKFCESFSGKRAKDFLSRLFLICLRCFRLMIRLHADI